MLDKGIQIRIGHCHVRRWIDDLLPLVPADDDPLGTETLATHRVPLDEAPAAYTLFQGKHAGCRKVVLGP